MSDTDEIELPDGAILAESLEGNVVLLPDGSQVPLAELQHGSQPVQWMDADTDALDQSLQTRANNRNLLMEWLWGALVENTDYGTIKAGQKPSLWQPGAEKICGYLGLIARFPDSEKYVDMAASGHVPDAIIVRCYLYDPAGNVIGEGTGAREASQSPKLNDRIKMAQKSALIDAVKRAAGLSEVFTQDETDESAGAVLDDEARAYLEAKAKSLFPDTYIDVLYSLAKRRFNFSDGDWQQIPMARLPDAIRSLEDKAGDTV